MIIVMEYNQMTNIVVGALSIIAIVMSVNALNNSNNSIDISLANSEWLEVNTRTLIGHESLLSQLGTYEKNDIMLMETIFDKLEVLEDASDVSNFEARLLIAENGIRTLSNNQIKVPTHESEMSDFNLVLLDRDSIVQEVFGLNDNIYITGDAGATVHQTISLKIRDNDGNVLSEKEFGIPSEGRFTSAYSVPDLNSGVYTITITDGVIVDSITFIVE